MAPAADSGVVEHGLAALSADLREAVRLLGERLDGVGRLVQQRGQDLAEMRTAVEQLRESIAGQARAVEGVAGGLGALPSFGERIEALQSTLGELGQRLGGLEELAAGVEGLQQRAEAGDASCVSCGRRSPASQPGRRSCLRARTSRR